VGGEPAAVQRSRGGGYYLSRGRRKMKGRWAWASWADRGGGGL
jgi:hypothetical protein